MQSGIYKITCTANNSYLYGSSVHIKKRWNQHKLALRKGVHANRYLQAVWNKYGEDSFRWEVVESVEPNHKLVTEIENRYILTVLGQPGCMNMQTATILPENVGERLSKAIKGSYTHTDEAKQKISLAQKGRTKSEEECERLRIAHTGKTHTSETKRKISTSLIGNTHTKGHKFSEQSRLARSERMKAYWANPENRKKQKEIMSSPEVVARIKRGMLNQTVHSIHQEESRS